MSDPSIFLGRSPESQYLLARQGNRHGLIAGATGTGKTISLRVLAEGFSRLGVPVFMADVKGDLSGLAHPGVYSGKVKERAEQVGLEGFETRAFPVIFWDLYGEQGHPVRAVVQDMGPLLLARLMELNEVQEGILNIAFAVSEAERLPMLDFKDLRSVLENISNRADELRGRYGNVSAQSVGAIQRQLLALERQEAERFFGEPELELEDLMRVSDDGLGYISVLAADRLLAQSPQLYSIFLMWLLSRLFEELPEQGDADKPKLVFFFDEAHLLFNDAPKALVNRIEQVARLIRSKGVGVYFVSQSPSDIPDDILGQLGNRVQHALRAFTPKDQKAVRAAAESFRANGAFDTATAIQELGIGEALTSTLDRDGVPTPVERTLMAPPASRLKPLTPEERQGVITASPVKGKYERTLDRDSAYERLTGRENERNWSRHVEEDADAPKPAARKKAPPAASRRETVAEAAAKSAARSVASGLGRQIVKSLFNMIFKK